MKRLLVLLSLASCADHRGPLIGGAMLNSLQIVLHDPQNVGDPAHPIAADHVTYDVIALDINGNQVMQDMTVKVFASFGGVKTGSADPCSLDPQMKPADPVEGLPLDYVPLKNGVAMNHTTMLPPSYGSTAIWAEEPATHVAGASPVMWFANPLVAQVQTPVNPMAANATICSPYNGRFIIIDHPTGNGQLVVSSVFGNAFAVTDTGAPPGSYNSIYLFAFGKPPLYIVPGRVLSDFSGNYAKFYGFTELNFPLFDAALKPGSTAQDPIYVDLAPVPPPIDLAFADFGNLPKLVGISSSVVRYSGVICNMMPANPAHDPNIQNTIDQWVKYNQFVIDNDMTCDGFTNPSVELPSKTLGGFDPTKNVGNLVTVVGMLQNHSGQNPMVDPSTGQILACSPTGACTAGGKTGVCIQGECYKNAYNFWNIMPRTPDDVIVTPQ